MALKPNVRELLIRVGKNLTLEAAKTTLSFQQRIDQLRGLHVSDEEIRKIFLRDFVSENPVLFGALRANARDEIIGAVHQANSLGAQEAIGEGQARWTTVGDERVCIDCKGRAGQVRPMSEWELIGLPASGFSRCDRRCRCQLTPESAGAPDRIDDSTTQE